MIGGDYQGLGIARSLGRHGIPVCVLDDERAPASASRYVAHTTRVPDLRDDDAALAAIERAAREVAMDGWLLYPTRDETVALLARHRGDLEPRFRVTSPSWAAVRVCWDKRETYRTAAELGIDHPRTWVPQGPDDLEDLVDADAEGPFVVKPAIKEHFFYSTGVKAWRVDARDELAAVVARATAVAGPGEILVQELVPGGGREQYSYCALVRAGTPVAVMTVRRRRQHPSEFGRASTFVETVDLPELDAPSERFLAAVDYDGLVELEYKRDPRDGRARLLDVNARTWGYHSLGAAAGVDFPYLLHRACTEDAPPPATVRTRPGVRWIRLATDLPNAVRDVRAGTQRLGTYLRTLPGADTEAVFSLRDPLPWFYECALLPYLAVRRGL
ncbi:hypothetical protein PHK61_26615 [Actinomycetospora lutea]|uniref:carboxylate--amine ligase n=1 Tax=Actinomycetospora lutea TaxID=663604 RepID=UPI002366029B|nr:hypothetical protein [Actinomycetospora lutea]MDD7941994.1 hypothetical protein [Actinomycetospora lutea]